MGKNDKQAKAVKFSFFIILLFIFLTVAHLVRDGFLLRKVFLYPPIEHNEPCDPKILSVLDQNFYYLGKGFQAYAFVSQDGNTVLKLLRVGKYLRPLWNRFLYPSDKLANEIQKWNEIFSSYKLAYEELSSKTKVRFLHVQKSGNLKKRINIFDKLGIRHKVELDNIAFLVQDKALPLELYLSSEEDIQALKQVISSYLALIKYLALHGVRNGDSNLLRNCGVLNGEVIDMDVGSYKKNSDLKFLRAELEKGAAPLRNILKKKDLSLVSFLNEQIELVQKEIP